MKYYLIKADIDKFYEIITKDKKLQDYFVNIISQINYKRTELTEEELTKLQTILMNEVGFHSNMRDGKKFEVMYDKIRKVSE